MQPDVQVIEPSCSTGMGLPADFHVLLPILEGAKPSRVARSRYMPAITWKVNCPARSVRTDWGLPPTPSTGRSVTSERASGRPVAWSSTTPRITAACAAIAQRAARSNPGILEYDARRRRNAHKFTEPARRRAYNDRSLIAMMQLFSGVIAAAVTPHGKRGDEPDIGATLELIDFLCAAGVHGIALLGSTGEFVNLNSDDRVRLVYLAVKRSRVPVLAGVAHSTLDGALALGREACAAVAAGLLLMPPYFFRYGQPEIREFYLKFVELNHGVPIYLYNIPAFTSEIASETAIQLLATGRFAGIKDSSGGWDNFQALNRYKRQHPYTLLVGHDGIVRTGAPRGRGWRGFGSGLRRTRTAAVAGAGRHGARRRRNRSSGPPPA